MSLKQPNFTQLKINVKISIMTKKAMIWLMNLILMKHMSKLKNSLQNKAKMLTPINLW